MNEPVLLDGWIVENCQDNHPTSRYPILAWISPVKGKELGVELRKMGAKDGALVHVADVLAIIKGRACVVSEFIEWDDAIAAHLYRCSQMEQLFNGLTINAYKDSDDEDQPESA